MKKLIFTTVIAAAVAISAHAQSISLRGGLNLANIVKSGDKDFSTDFKPGFHAGVAIDIPIVAGLGLSPEVLYSQKGYKVTESLINSEYSVTTNFIDIPVMLKFKGSGFNIHVGPQISFLTSTTTKWDKGDQQYKETVDNDNDNLKKNIISGVAGIGVDLSSKLSLIGRYGLDFKKNNGDGSSTTPEYRNQVIQIGLGVKL